MNLKLRDIVAINIKSSRLSKKMSQEDLADISGIHRTYISAVERGKRNISIDNIERIAAALEIPPSKLLEK